MRLKKLVRTDVQVKLTLYFALLSVFSLVFQFLLMLNAVSAIPSETLGAPGLAELVVEATTRTLWLSLAVVVPVTTLVGVLSTFRIAGPLYRFGVFLRQVQAGDRPADCRLRKGDELQDLCVLLNETTAPLRHAASAGDDAVDDAGEREAA